MSFFQDLKQRGVFRVAAAYAVVAWLLLQIADVILPTFDAPAWIMQVFTVSLALGFPVALILAWVFDLTPDGLRRTTISEPPDEATQAAHTRLNIATIGLLAFAVVFMFVDNYVLSGDSDSDDGLAAGPIPLVVLPFDDLSEGSDKSYFAEGVGEAVRNALTSVRQLHVIARTSASSFRGTDATVREIADRLKVTYVLEGTVRTAGDQIRVSVQLVDGNTERRLWGQVYTQSLGNVFDIQDDIASNVVLQLTNDELNILPETDIASDPQAYQLYLQAKQALQNASQSAESLTRAIGWLEDAIERDPDYFPAHITRVELYDQMRRAGMLESANYEEILAPLIEEVAARWPDRPEVRILQAGRDLYSDPTNPRWESAARNIEYALRADPANLEYLAEAANLANLLNRDELALEIARYTVARDPLCAVCYLQLSGTLMGEEQYEASVENYEVAITLDPTLTQPGYPLALIFIGQAERALEILRSPEYASGRPGLRRTSVAGSAIALHYLGRLEESQAAIEELKQMDWSGNALAQFYALTGNLDAAFETINSLPRDEILPRAFDNALRSLKNHPNWPELGSRLGLWPDDPRDEVSFSVNLPAY